MTFIGKIEGLKAASLHSQYFEEYVLLSRYVDRLLIVTDTLKTPVKDLHIPDNVQIAKVPAIRVPKVYGSSKTLFYTMAPLMRRIDTIYVRTFSPPELCSLWVGSGVFGLPSVLVLPGTWLFGPPSRPIGKEKFYRWFLRRALDAADRVILYSRLMLPDVLLYHPNVNTSKFRYVHNAVNIERYSPLGDPDPDLVRIKGGRRCVLYVGRINEKKGIRDLILAFERVAREVPDSVLVLVGEGSKDYVMSLRGVVSSKHLADRVIFLGPVPNERVPKVLRTADVIAYPSREGEGIPRAILEALATGKPVVATRVAGTPEAVIDGHTGLIVEPRDVNGLSDRILRLLNDERTARLLGSRGRELVEREFSYDVVLPKVAELIREVNGK